MIKWLVVFGIAFIIVLVGSVGKVPFSERKLATSEETRAKFAEENTPTYTRPQVVSFIEDYLRTSCESGHKYLLNIDLFEAKWTRSPRNDDHHERDVREWTVSDPITSSFWRLYENTMEIVTVRADC